MRGDVPVAVSQRIPTKDLAAWMRLNEVPFSGLIRTGWVPSDDQWQAIFQKWFPEFDPDAENGS